MHSGFISGVKKRKIFVLCVFTTSSLRTLSSKFPLPRCGSFPHPHCALGTAPRALPPTHFARAGASLPEPGERPRRGRPLPPPVSLLPPPCSPPRFRGCLVSAAWSGSDGVAAFPPPPRPAEEPPPSPLPAR